MAELIARNERRAAYWRDRATVLPDWAKALPSYLQTHLLNALAEGDLKDLRRETIRGKGETWWLRIEGFGRRSERTLCAAIGGWSNKAPELAPDLPDWAQVLSWRLQNTLRHALADGGISGLDREAVRKAGPQRFMRYPNCGKVSVAELGHAIGGWQPPAPAAPAQPMTTPDWIDDLSVRSYYVLKHALADGAVPDLEMETVRRLGEGFWLQRPDCGRKVIRELAEVIGGWPVPTLAHVRQELAAIRARLAVLEAELDRLGA